MTDSAGEGRVAYDRHRDECHECGVDLHCNKAVELAIAARLRAVEEENVRLRVRIGDRILFAEQAQAEARRLRDRLSLARSALRHAGLAERVIEARLRLPDEPDPGGA